MQAEREIGEGGAEERAVAAAAVTPAPPPWPAGCIQVSDITMKLLEGEALEYTGGVDVKGKGKMDTYVWTPPAMMASAPRPISGPPTPAAPALNPHSESGLDRRAAANLRTSLPGGVCSLKGAGMQRVLTSSTSKKKLAAPSPKLLRSSSSKKQMDISQIVTHVLTKFKTQGKPKPSSTP